MKDRSATVFKPGCAIVIKCCRTSGVMSFFCKTDIQSRLLEAFQFHPSQPRRVTADVVISGDHLQLPYIHTRPALIRSSDSELPQDTDPLSSMSQSASQSDDTLHKQPAIYMTRSEPQARHFPMFKPSAEHITSSY